MVVLLLICQRLNTMPNYNLIGAIITFGEHKRNGWCLLITKYLDSKDLSNIIHAIKA